MVLVDGRVVSLDGERRVSFDELTSFGVDRWRASLFVDWAFKRAWYENDNFFLVSSGIDGYAPESKETKLLVFSNSSET